MIGDLLINHLKQIGHLDDDDQNALREMKGELRDVSRGDSILSVGEHPRHVVAVVSGLLHRCTVSGQGRRQIHSFYLPTDTPSMETLHIPVMDNTLVAAASGRIALVTHGEIRGVFDRRPRVRDLCWRETLVQASIIRAWLMRNSQMLAHAQMAHLFCELLARATASGLTDRTSFGLPIKQDDLADALGMTVTQANRTLQVLRATRAVEFRNGVLSVFDPDQLMSIAEFDPKYLHHV
jgi:CRP-like cAMP-binding protein